MKFLRIAIISLTWSGTSRFEFGFLFSWLGSAVLATIATFTYPLPSYARDSGSLS